MARRRQPSKTVLQFKKAQKRKPTNGTKKKAGAKKAGASKRRPRSGNVNTERMLRKLEGS
jgi:hypothetical protein